MQSDNQPGADKCTNCSLKRSDHPLYAPNGFLVCRQFHAPLAAPTEEPPRCQTCGQDQTSRNHAYGDSWYDHTFEPPKPALCGVCGYEQSHASHLDSATASFHRFVAISRPMTAAEVASQKEFRRSVSRPVPEDGEPRVHGVTWVVVRDGRVILERCPKKASNLGVGEWFVPGGKVECDETAEDACRREVAEEWPGIDITAMTLLPLVEGSRVPPGDGGVFLMRPFALEIEGDLPSHSADGPALRWTPLDEALASPVPQVRMMVAAALASPPLAREPEARPLPAAPDRAPLDPICANLLCRHAVDAHPRGGACTVQYRGRGGQRVCGCAGFVARLDAHGAARERGGEPVNREWVH